MSLVPQGNKETTMALLDPSAASRPASPRAKGWVHPSVWLVAGFVLTLAAAYGVHVLFNAVI